MIGKRTQLWLLIFSGISLALLIAVFFFQTHVDPFGVWGAHVKPGMNNSRVGQLNTDRMFKPYQLAQRSPEVVFIGTSHVEYGMPPRWGTVSAEKVYNFGFGSLNLGEALAYVQFLETIPTLRVVAIEVSPIFFSGNVRQSLPGFSRERLRAIARNPITGGLEKLKDTVFNFDAVRQSIDTLEDSRLNPEQQFFDDKGWFVFSGKKTRPHTANYRLVMWNYAKGYFRIIPRQESAFDLFKRIVKRLQKRGIEVVLFHTPLSVDLQMMIDIQGLGDYVEEIQRTAVSVAPVWDFGGVNGVTQNMWNYTDGSHFLGRVGHLMIDRMSADDSAAKPPMLRDFGVLLTGENIETHLLKKRMALEKMKTENARLYKAFQDADRTGDQAAFMAAVEKRYTF